MTQQTRDCYLPFDAEIVARALETADIITLTLKFSDLQQQKNYCFSPGQFNMLYLFGIGEVPISIVSDPEDNTVYAHTIRRLGRVTQGLSLLKVGDHVGVRGPFGRGWPLQIAKGKDVLIITGGLGCAPSITAINYILQHREAFGKLTILQGVKHSDDLIFRKQYEKWAKLPDVQVMLAADVAKPNWPGYSGLVTELIDRIQINNNSICLLCGPEIMMCAAIASLIKLKISEEAIYLTLERNMECAVGHCGHCQFGSEFICKNGPVFCYPEVKHFLGRKGF